MLGALYAARPDAPEFFPETLAYFRSSILFGRSRPARSDGLHSRSSFFGNLARKAATAGVVAAVSFRLGLKSFNPVDRAIDYFFGDGRIFENLLLPFGVNAIDLTGGKVEEFVSGPLAPALKAGVAIGLVFAPFTLDGRQYADAAPVSPLPVGLCQRLGAEKVLAVDISAPLEKGLKCGSGFDVARRLMSVQSAILTAAEAKTADYCLEIDVSDIFWGDFSRVDEAFDRGRRATEEALSGIRKALCLT
jgi:predicted acylesterase/phospholipase RssA